MADFLVSVDPGLRKCGWARWYCGKLVDCCVSKAPRTASLQECVKIHSQPRYTSWQDRVVCERMTYRGAGGKGSPQVLMDLNLIAGALGTEWVTPNEWKGSRPRAVEQTRTSKALSPAELALLPVLKHPDAPGHDVWSAVGIGLYVLGRY